MLVARFFTGRLLRVGQERAHQYVWLGYGIWASSRKESVKQSLVWVEWFSMEASMKLGLIC